MTRKVKTTLRPDEEIEVDDAEFTDLDRQGLIHEVVEDDQKTEEKPKESGNTTSSVKKKEA